MSRRSTTSFSLLHLLLLLFLAVCSCKARPIGVIKKQDVEPSRSSYFSSKDEEKSSSDARVFVSSNAKSSNQNESELVAKLDGSQLNKRPKSARKVEHHSDHELKDDDQRHKVGADDVVQSEQSPASVSWKLPHPKAGERQPGFNLDYDPPRTHPPVHN